MSTNLERITAHNERLAAMKETVAGLPDAGGGGAVETCTVEIPQAVPVITAATIYENRTFLVACLDYTGQPSSHAIPNVVCGSMLLLGIPASWGISPNGAELVAKATALNMINVFKITASSGETVTFNFEIDA